MNSPLVTRILGELKTAVDERRRALLSSELGRYWARVGEFEEAERIRTELRRNFGDGRDLRVSVSIMTIEALILFYRDLNPGARDWLTRACALSRAAGDKWLIALTSAWMAHIEFNQNRFDSMAHHLLEAQAAIGENCDEACCRLAIVVGDALLFVGQATAADQWYERARRSAVILGDRAAIGAMTYNRAALMVARARFQSAAQVGAEIDIASVRVSVDSAVNYQAIANLKSLDHLLVAAKIGCLMLQENFESALALIQDTVNSEVIQNETDLGELFAADYTRCLARLGRQAELGDRLNLRADSFVMKLSADDRAVALSSLRDASIAVGERVGDYIESSLSIAVMEHKAIVEKLANQLGALSKMDSESN